jgi:hypothetical protein
MYIEFELGGTAREFLGDEAVCDNLVQKLATYDLDRIRSPKRSTVNVFKIARTDKKILYCTSYRASSSLTARWLLGIKIPIKFHR